jgi:dipeptide/tripeptide permease
VLLLVNTLLVIAFQVRASRLANTVMGAGRLARRAGMTLFLVLAMISFTDRMAGWLAAGILVVAIVIYAFGEMWQAAAAFELSFELAPSHAKGQYAGVFSVGQNLSIALAPGVLSVVCLAWKQPGWLGLGTVLLIAGAVTPTVVSHATRNRPTADMPSVRA